MKSWEYLVEDSDLGEDNEHLKKLLEDAGLGGWELVSLIPMPGPDAAKFLAVFKKPSMQG